MNRSRKSYRLLVLAFLLLALLLVPWPGIFGSLRVRWDAGGRTLLRFPFILRHPFHLGYTHSIYVTPVVEKFQVVPSAIRLREIATRHWGVIEYYGAPGILQEEEGEMRLREIKFQVSRFSVMIGFVGKQRLFWGEQTYALYELVQPGDVLTFEPETISLARYLWEKILSLDPIIRRAFGEDSIPREGARIGPAGFQKGGNGWPSRRGKGPA